MCSSRQVGELVKVPCFEGEIEHLILNCGTVGSPQGVEMRSGPCHGMSARLPRILPCPAQTGGQCRYLFSRSMGKVSWRWRMLSSAQTSSTFYRPHGSGCSTGETTIISQPATTPNICHVSEGTQTMSALALAIVLSLWKRFLIESILRFESKSSSYFRWICCKRVWLLGNKIAAPSKDKTIL